MTWQTETSGVISLSSSGQWLTNLLSQKGFANTGSTTSVAAVWTDTIGSDKVKQYALINE